MGGEWVKNKNKKRTDGICQSEGGKDGRMKEVLLGTMDLKDTSHQNALNGCQHHVALTKPSLQACMAYC